MGSAKDAAVKGYIRLPKAVRRFTDPLVKNRGKAQELYEKRRQKGKQMLKGKMRAAAGGKKRRRSR